MAMGTMCRQGARLAMQQRAMPPALVRRAGRDSHLPGFVDCLASLEPKALSLEMAGVRTLHDRASIQQGTGNMAAGYQATSMTERRFCIGQLRQSGLFKAPTRLPADSSSIHMNALAWASAHVLPDGGTTPHCHAGLVPPPLVPSA